jgi:beta-glucanase (GH16 family)
MTTNQIGTLRPTNGLGYGFGFETTDRYGAKGLDSVGAFGWGGAYGSVYRVDPTSRLTIVFMMQLIPNQTDIRDVLPTVAYQAFTTPSGQGAAAATGGPDTAARELLFFDDFAGPTLDRNRWNVIVTGRTVNNEQQAYVDSPETIAFATGQAAQGAVNGALAITARSRPGFKTPEGRTFDFISGRLDTRGKFDFTYGTAAARLKLTAGAGLWPAFWVLGNGRWPETGEMDIMENVGDPSWTNVALHGPGYSGNTPLVMRHPFGPAADATGWHVYSMDWSPEGFVFEVDDVPFYAVTKRMVEVHGPWAYDNPKHLIVNLAIGGAYPRGVNKVEAPYVGLPAPTVDLIKADKAVMLVDWVRVIGQRH